MKKLFFATAIAIGSLTAVNAQSTAIAQGDNAEVKQSVEAKQAPVQDFKEIKASELPKAIVASLDKDFKGATVAKAYKNAKNQYKLVISTADGQKKTVYANSEGQWLETKKKMK